jgi:hypothetical protein
MRGLGYLGNHVSGKGLAGEVSKGGALSHSFARGRYPKSKTA